MKTMKATPIAWAVFLSSAVAVAEPSSTLDLPVVEATSFVTATPALRERAPREEAGSLRPGSHVLQTADVAARVGPAGAAVRVGLLLHHTYEVDATGDHENSYLEAGLAFMATPATLEPQLHVELLPWPFLVLRGEFAAVRYLGLNYGLLNFDSPSSAFGSEALSARKGDEQQAWGMRGGLSVTPRVKLGRVLLRSKFSATGYHFDQPGPYVYDADLDTLLATTDLVLSNRSDVLFELHDGPGAETLLLGPSMETRRTLDSALSRTRLGAALWYVPTERWANLRQPRLYAQAGVNAVDPNRRGEPYCAVGFGADFY
jgi:hypothetical protein